MEMVDPMRSDPLLDYSLGQLECQDLVAFEAELARDPDLFRQSEQLGKTIRLLVDDGQSWEPPSGLASRTLAFVDEQNSSRAILELAPRRRSFRWTDLAVAAGILLAGVLTLLPAVKSRREQMNQLACADNLRELGTNLANYAVRHDHYPKVIGGDNLLPVGYYAQALQQDSLLTDSKNLHCPCKGDCPVDLLQTNLKHMDFGYNVGYVDQQSGLAEPISPRLPFSVPLLADQPPHDGHGHVLEGNSPNHGRRGQNVLFSDQSLRWLPTREVGPQDHDLFLNEMNRPEPGISFQDATVIPAAFHVRTSH